MKEKLQNLISRYVAECEERRYDFYGAQVDLQNIVEDLQDIINEVDE